MSSRRHRRVILCTADFFAQTSVPLANALAAKFDLRVFMSVLAQCGHLADDPLADLQEGIRRKVLRRPRRMRNPLHIVSDWRLAREIFELKPDALLVDSVVSPWFFPWWCLLYLTGIPIVYMVHDVRAHSGSEHKLEAILQRWRIRCSSAVIVFSQQQRRELWQQMRRESEVIHLPSIELTSSSEEGSRPEPEPDTVLLFGALRLNKGIDLFIDAIERVVGAVPGLHVIVAGERGVWDQFASRILSRDRYELHLGRVSNAEMIRFFQRAQCVILPYHDATQSGIPLVAYALDRPVIATTVGGVPEYVVDNVTGVLVPPNDPAALGEAIIRFLGDAPLRETMRAHVRQFARDAFAATDGAAKIADLINDIVGKTRP